MWTGIELLLFLQDIRESMPDLVSQFFLLISNWEFQYFIPVLLMAFLFWCIGEKEGELLMFNFGFSNIIGYVMKNIVKQPRPWILDSDLHPSAEAKKGAPGYSLPSGHTTSAVSAYGTMAWMCRRRTIPAVVFLSLVILIPFARLYLTVHTPLDIIVGAVIAITVCYANCRILKWSYTSDKNRMLVLIGYLIVGLTLSVICDVSAGKVLSNKMCGFCIALPLCLLMKERFPDYCTCSSFKERVKAAVPGLCILMVIMESVSRLMPAYGIITGLTIAIVFVILVYPMMMKKLLEPVPNGH